MAWMMFKYFKEWFQERLAADLMALTKLSSAPRSGPANSGFSAMLPALFRYQTSRLIAVMSLPDALMRAMASSVRSIVVAM